MASERARAPRFFGSGSDPVAALHHWLGVVFRSMGYRWEIFPHPSGEIGMWRKSLHRKPRYRTPRRFVLVPGFGDSPLSWILCLRSLRSTLRKHFDEVVLVDYPGFGGWLNQAPAIASLDDLFSASCALLAELEPHTVLAHSLGGWIVGEFAARKGLSNPHAQYEVPKVCILVNPSGVYGSEALKLSIQSQFTQAQKDGFRVLRPHLFAREPFWFRLVEGQMHSFILRPDIQRFMNSVDESHILEDRIGAATGAFWIIWGAQDTLVPVACLPSWLELLGRRKHDQFVQGITINRAGHSPHLEQRRVLSRLLRLILDQSSAQNGHSPPPPSKRWRLVSA